MLSLARARRTVVLGGLLDERQELAVERDHHALLAELARRRPDVCGIRGRQRPRWGSCRIMPRAGGPGGHPRAATADAVGRAVPCIGIVDRYRH